MDEPKSFDEVLTHFGMKGMRWGIRKANRSTSVPASEDAARANSIRQKIKVGGTQSLKNDELQALVSRMNLEQQYSSLVQREPSKVSRGHDTVKKVLSIVSTLQQVHSFAKGPLGKELAKQFIKK